MAEAAPNGSTATEPKKDPQALRALASRVQPSVVSFVTYDGNYGTLAEGAGFFIAPGRVATSRHLLRGARHARVMLHDGKVHDVGLATRGDAYKGFNPPSLLGAYDRLLYLHDGRARSIEEVLRGPHNPASVTGRPLAENELKDLVEYLQAL